MTFVMNIARVVRSLVSLSFVAVVSAQAAKLPEGRLGVGILLGDPTGLTARYSTDADTRIHGAFAYDFGDGFTALGDYIRVFSDAQFLPPNLRGVLHPYMGVGLVAGVAKVSDNPNTTEIEETAFRMGIRVPLGFEWKPSSGDIGVFVEVAPGLSLISKTDVLIQGGIGIVYYVP